MNKNNIWIGVGVILAMAIGVIIGLAFARSMGVI